MIDDYAINKSALREFLFQIFKAEVKIIDIRNLSGEQHDQEIKGFGYGEPILVEIRVDGIPDQIIIHTVRQDKYGHERRSDRASNILLDFDTFNKLPRHVPCLGVGAFTDEGKMLPLMDSKEFFLVTRYVKGRVFAEDLKKLLEAEKLIVEDKSRVLRLTDYLVQIHDQKNIDADLYRRSIREVFGRGEGIWGLIDSYPTDFEIAPPSRMHAIERQLVDWRWRLKKRTDRLSQVHGDFHPWNILFQTDGEFYVLDRSRGQWGEPADDVSAFSINFIFFSLQQSGFFSGPFKVLFDTFWEHYLQQTKDLEIHRIIQPFYAWRALVLAHPVWYPNISETTRNLLFNFIENVLAEEWFRPEDINTYLGIR